MIKDLLVRISATWAGLKNALKSAVSVTRSSAKQIEGAASQIEEGLNSAFKGNFRQSIAELNDLIQTNKNRLIEARGELQKLQATLRNQKKGTKEFADTEVAIRRAKQVVQEYTRDVAELNTQLRDQKNALADSRLQAEDNSSAMEALGRAVNAASMATLLMVGDNKKLEPALKAVQTTMALAQGAIAIYNLSLRENNILTTLGTGAQRAYAFAVGTSTGAMKLFRLALAATGVGVLVIALGELVALLMDTEQNLDKVNNKLDQLSKRNQYAEDSISSIISAIERQTELDIARARLAGKSETEIQKIREKSNNQIIDQINEQKRIYQENYKSQRDTINKEIEDAAEKRKRISELDDQREKDIRAFNDRIAELQNQIKIEAIELEINKNEKLAEQDKKRLEKTKKKLEDERKAYEDYWKQVIDEGKQYQQFLIDQMQEGKDKELAQLKFNFENEIAAIKTNNALKRGLTDKYNKDVAAVNQKYAYKEFDAETRRVDQAIQNAQNLARAKKNAQKESNEELLKEQEKFNQKINEQFKNALNQFSQSVVSEISNSIRRAFEGVGESSKIGLEILKLQQKELEQTMQDMERSEIDRLQARQQYLKNQEDILEQSRSNMSKLFRGILLAIGDFLVQLGTSLIVTAVATEKFKESLFSNPKAAAVAGLAAVTAGLATRAVIERGPRFANGGIVSGPTLGLVGEYPGASTNPEVIAPLDKLQSMLGGTGSGENGFIAETRVSGRDLALVLSRYNKDAQRG
jgi:hypothetical protein